jgi:hypothetical protein
MRNFQGFATRRVAFRSAAPICQQQLRLIKMLKRLKGMSYVSETNHRLPIGAKIIPQF